MKTILIIYIVIVTICIICATIAACSPFIPMIVEHKSWKAWKECYNSDNFVKTYEGERGMKYECDGMDYYIDVFKADGKYEAAIFRKSAYGSPVFCTYYKYHARKLAKKLMASNK